VSQLFACYLYAVIMPLPSTTGELEINFEWNFWAAGLAEMNDCDLSNFFSGTRAADCYLLPFFRAALDCYLIWCCICF
jgi:hypothetical protein